LQLNRAEFDGLSDEARIKFEGFRPGLYVRVQINDMPAEFISNFEPTYPVVLGGLLSAEQNVGYVTVGATLCSTLLLVPIWTFLLIRIAVSWHLAIVAYYVSEFMLCYNDC